MDILGMMLQLHSNEKCFKESYFISKIKYTPCIKGPPVPTWTPKPHMMVSLNFAKHLGQSLSHKHTGCM